MAAAKARYALGRSRLLASDFEGAIAHLGDVLRAFEREPSLAASLVEIDASARSAIGTALARQARLREAAAIYDDLIARHGATPERLDARGEVERASLGDVSLMLDCYQRALALDPDYLPARLHLAKLMRELPNLEIEAERQLLDLLHRDPSHGEARALLERWRGESRDRARNR
jgi:tetratricopeptide (TPR) repeat protein